MELNVAWKGVANSFSLLFKGKINLFFASLAGGLIMVVGVFLIILALMMVISRLTLFRKEEHQKFAWYFSVGFALIGSFTAPVFALVSGFLGGTFLEIIIILFFIYAVIAIVYKLRSATSSAAAESNQARTSRYDSRKDRIIAKKGSMKEQHDADLEKRLEGREKRATNSVLNTLDKVTNFSSWRDAIAELERLLGRYAQVRGTAAAGELKQALLSKASALTGKIKKEFANLEAARTAIKTLETYVNKGIGLYKDENEHFEYILGTHATILADSWAVDRKLVFAMLEKKLGLEFKNMLKKLYVIEQYRKKFIKTINDLIFEAEKLDEELLSLKEVFIQQCHNADTAGALGTLEKIKNIVGKIGRADTALGEYLANVKGYTTIHDNAHEKVEDFFKDFKDELKRLPKPKKTKPDEKMDEMSDKFDSLIKRIDTIGSTVADLTKITKSLLKILDVKSGSS